jgi:hypothetical protein
MRLPRPLPADIGRTACFLATDCFPRHTTSTVVTVDVGLWLFSRIPASEPFAPRMTRVLQLEDPR